MLLNIKILQYLCQRFQKNGHAPAKFQVLEQLRPYAEEEHSGSILVPSFPKNDVMNVDKLVRRVGQGSCDLLEFDVAVGAAGDADDGELEGNEGNLKDIFVCKKVAFFSPTAKIKKDTKVQPLVKYFLHPFLLRMKISSRR